MQRGDVVAERFEIERPAGWGGMGIVYRAVDRLTGEPVAVKVLRGVREEDLRRFAREVQVLAELRHPRIVRYVAHGATPSGEPYLAMEWLQGEDLGDRLNRGPLRVSDSVTLIRCAAAALGVAHARGVLHRDVKPGNLFLPDRDIERVTLLDFGVARLSHQAPTSTGMTVGTPGYMAPEQARSGDAVDARADVFSLGCVLFECLTGRPAFSGDHMMTILSKVLLEPVPRVNELARGVPPALDDLVAAMLSKQPDERPADGAAVAAALGEIGTLDSVRDAVQSPSRRSITSDEQRMVSVVVAEAADRSRPAGLASSRDEEAETLGAGELRAPLQPLRDALAIYGASVEPLVDGSVVATLMGSGVATDQAAKAALSALTMRAHLPGVAVVVATGRAVFAGQLPMGEAIERAVQLLRATQALADAVGRGRESGARARPSIVLDEVTAGLLDARFVVESAGAMTELVGAHEAVDAARTLLGRATPCVGREREMRVLGGLFDECARDRVASAALVIAPAGAGKSRLRYELLRALRARGGDLEILVGRGDSMRAGAPFGILAPALLRAADVHEGERLAVRRDKLAARVARHVAPAERRRVTEFLGELTGVPFDPEDSMMLRAAREDAMLMSDQMHRAWEDFLAAECEVKPVLLVLEDLQWGDLPSVELVDRSLRNLKAQPFMVLALARPEVKELFGDLWKDRGIFEMNLPPLTRKAAERLVREVLGEESDAALVARVVERAQGNAFFLEELIRAVASGQADVLPETILAVVQARLEAFDPAERRLLRAASVFGDVFWEGGVRALLGGADGASEVGPWLRVLAEREAVVLRSQSSFPGEVEYVFRQALLREAAYAALTEEDRRLGHRLAGEWLEAAGEGHAFVLAEHFERGGDKRRAALYLRRAAEQALEANDLAGALARAGRATRCGAEGAELGALRLLQAEAHRWRGEFPQAAARGTDAMELLPPRSARWFHAAAEVATARNRVGDHDGLQAIGETLRATEVDMSVPGARGALVAALARVSMHLLIAGRYTAARALAERVDAIAPAMGDLGPAVTARLDALRALRASFDDDLAAYRTFTESAIAGYVAVGDLRAACLQQVNLGDALRKLGMYAEAEPVLAEALASSRALGLAYLGALAKFHLAEVRAAAGARAEGLSLAREAVDTFHALGDRRWEGAARDARAALLAEAGELTAAEKEARTAVEQLAVAPPLGVHALATTARVLLLRGDAATALAITEEAVALLTRLGKIEEGEAFVQLVHAEALAKAGEPEQARLVIRAARESLLARADTIRDETMRAAFLERVPAHARTLELARIWG